MGVADSPDLANLYGWYFEREAGILSDPTIPYYGRYIDDCFAIVYANSEAEALANVSNTIKFDGCVIEWDAGFSAPFLDMLLYVDVTTGKLEHMPYRKARSHQERVPWISHHPIDVKRGTFIGEMSRLATLCSKLEHYKDAMASLAGLYVQRGYPQDLVYHWLRDNISKRWENRLNAEKPERSDVLVLKSEFNTAWNYFSARELGDTVLGFWRTSMERADSGHFDAQYPIYPPESNDLVATVRPELTTLVLATDGNRYPVPDIRKLDILNRRMIVSRKRTRNLFDLTSLWKKTVLHKYENDASDTQNPNDNLGALVDPEGDSDNDSIWEDELDLDPRHDPSSLEFVAGSAGFVFDGMAL